MTDNKTVAQDLIAKSGISNKSMIFVNLNEFLIIDTNMVSGLSPDITKFVIVYRFPKNEE